MKAVAKRVFTRISATGNSFIICNSLPSISEPLAIEKRKELARKLCLEMPGLSADGFICLEPSQNSNFKWDFYNADGSSAEMCGNAARCVAIYYFQKIRPEKNIQFETVVGQVHAEIVNSEDQIVRAEMPKANILEQKKSIKIDGKNIRGFFVNTGVPHFVLQTDPDINLAKKIRKAKEFGEAGTNVTFVDFDETDYMHAVTYERGVEDFTLSCGTGAVAAAIFHKSIYENISELLVEMPGGVLSVDLKSEHPFLTSDVEIQFDFSIYEDIL